jgi:glycerol-3-phosphate acyltransferase PlsY
LNKTIFIAAISYLIGNFSSAYVLGRRLKKTDVRKYGSGNAGATNALRVFGVKIGLIVFMLDILKGIIASAIGNKILGFDGIIIAGIFVVLGHDWPIFLKFKGGKGIATSLGVMLYVQFPIALICTLIGFLVIGITKYVSLGSMIATLLVPIFIVLFDRPFNFKLFIFTVILASIAVFKHRSNISRLMNGKESKLGQRIQ